MLQFCLELLELKEKQVSKTTDKKRHSDDFDFPNIFFLSLTYGNKILGHLYSLESQCRNHFYPSTISGFFYHNSLDQSISNCRFSGYFLLLLCFIGIPVFNANSVDPDQRLHSAG